MRIALKYNFDKIHPGLNQTFNDILNMLKNLDKLNFQQYSDMTGITLKNVNVVDVQSITVTTLTIGGYTITSDELQYLDGLNQSLSTTDAPTFDDLTITNPVNIYALSHDGFADFVSNEHVAHTGTNLVSQIADRIITINGDVACHNGDIVYA